MRTSFIALATLFAGGIAMPATLSKRTFTCSSGTANCCDVDILGVADLNCETGKSYHCVYAGSI